jgi:hypothetical protein
LKEWQKFVFAFFYSCYVAQMKKTGKKKTLVDGAGWRSIDGELVEENLWREQSRSRVS